MWDALALFGLAVGSLLALLFWSRRSRPDRSGGDSSIGMSGSDSSRHSATDSGCDSGGDGGAGCDGGGGGD
jgi:hypothetical protein